MQSLSTESQTGRIRRGWSIAFVALVAIVFASACLMSTSSSRAAAAEAILEFDDAASPDDLAPVVADSVDGALRSRFATVATDELLAVLAADDVFIELFDDVVVDFGSSGDLTIGEAGHFTWSATTPDALATLSFADDGVRGSVSLGAATYSLIPAAGSTHLIFEEGRSLPNETEAVVPPTVGYESAADAPSSTLAPLDVGPAPAADGSAPVIKVLTVYDDFSRDYYGGDAGAVAWLSATIDEINAAYARSGANLVMESAAIEHVDYLGMGTPGSANAELNRLTGTTDGILDGVHARRDALGADLVVLVARLDATSTCGIGWLLTPPVGAGDAAFGFSVVEPRCARENLTFAHETGHNLGAGHGPPDVPGVVPYANGYRNEAAGYRTIMAYDSGSCALLPPQNLVHSCKRLPYYSSPTVLVNGQPTGSPTQDNARVLTELAPAVAQYRGGGGGAFVSLVPARLLDTRASGKVGSVDGGAGPVVLNVLGKGGLPGSGVGAVALNVTVAEGEGPVVGVGYVTVYPCGTRPNASNLNFVAGQTIPNSVIAPVSASGEVCFYVYGRAHLLVDVSGYFPTGSGIVSLVPDRLLDTRASGKVGSVDGGAGPVVLNVLGKGGLPGSGVGAVALNVTVAEGEGPVVGVGYVTVYPCGTRPNASNLNFVAGQTIPNSVIAPVSASGEVCFYVYGRAHLLVDVSGYFPTGSGIVSLVPDRLLDTRASGKVGSVDGGAGPVVLNVLGKGGLPGSGVGAVALNVTVAEGEGPVVGVGYVTVYPCGTRPNASNLNFVAGQTIPNSVIAPVSASGEVCFYVYGRAHLLVDVSGYFAA